MGNRATEIILLTGFLGAGKTTLLQQLLTSYRQDKVGVIVNEFGRVNIDARFLKEDGIRLTQLSNGSVFCACIKDKFVDSLIEMSKQELDYLLIESSGMADPSSMMSILNGIRKEVGRPLQLTGELCVVDCQTFLELSQVLPVLSRQLRYANAVLLNKCDLADSQTIAQICHRVEEANPNAKIYKTTYCQIDIRQIAAELRAPMEESEESTNTYESRPTALVMYCDQPLTRREIVAFLAQIAPYTYRIKGFWPSKDGVWKISAVSQNLEIEPWDRVEPFEVVAISSVGIKLVSVIIQASKETVNGKIHLS